MHHPTDRIAHTTAFVKPVVEHWLEGEIAQWVHPMKDRSDDPSHHERTLAPRRYVSLLLWNRFTLLLSWLPVSSGVSGAGFCNVVTKVSSWWLRSAGSRPTSQQECLGWFLIWKSRRRTSSESALFWSHLDWWSIYLLSGTSGWLWCICSAICSMLSTVTT